MEVTWLGTGLGPGVDGHGGPTSPPTPRPNSSACGLAARTHCGFLSTARAEHQLRQQGAVRALHQAAAGRRPARQVSVSLAPQKRCNLTRLPVLLGEARPPRPLGGGGQSQGRAWAAGHRADCAPPFNRCLWRAHPARLRLADLTVGHLPYQIRQPPQTPSIPNPSPLPRRHPASSDPTAQKTSCRVAQLPLSSAARLHCGGPQAGTVTSGDTCASGAEHRGLGNTDSSCKCTPQ